MLYFKTIFDIVNRYIDENIKSVIISDGETFIKYKSEKDFIDELDKLFVSHPDIKFTICFKNDVCYKNFRTIKKYPNVKICKASIPLNTGSSYDLALSIQPFINEKENYTKSYGFSSNNLCCVCAEDFLNNINSNGKVIFLAPSSIMRSTCAERFRTKIIDGYRLKTVSLFPGNKFTAVQTALFEIEHGVTTDIELNKYKLEDNELIKTESIPISKVVVEKQDSLLIHLFSSQQDGILKKYYEPRLEKQKLSNIAEVFRGKSALKYKATGNIKVINIIDVKESYIDFSNLRNISEEKRKNLKYELQDGDILLTARGTVMRTAVFEKPDNQMYVAAAGLIVIRPKNISISKYLQMFFSSEVGMKILDSYKAGQTFINILPIDVEKILIPAPTEKMLDYAKKFQKANDKVEEAKKEVEKLASDFLSEIFR